MHEEIFRALREGATIITASRRLARVLAGEFHSMEAARGRTVWNRPDILPLYAYLERASLAAMRRASVLLPAPAGPSIAIVIRLLKLS